MKTFSAVELAPASTALKSTSSPVLGRLSLPTPGDDPDPDLCFFLKLSVHLKFCCSVLLNKYLLTVDSGGGEGREWEWECLSLSRHHLG